MKEPVLHESINGTPTTFRVLILPTIGNSIAIRIVKVGELYELTSKRLSGDGGYNPGKLIENRTVALSADQAYMLDDILLKLEFMQMPTSEVSSPAVLDGTRWILEGIIAGEYHLVDRVDIDYEVMRRGHEPLLNLCKFLIDRSGIAQHPFNRRTYSLPLEPR